MDRAQEENAQPAQRKKQKRGEGEEEESEGEKGEREGADKAGKEGGRITGVGGGKKRNGGERDKKEKTEGDTHKQNSLTILKHPVSRTGEETREMTRLENASVSRMEASTPLRLLIAGFPTAVTQTTGSHEARAEARRGQGLVKQAALQQQGVDGGVREGHFWRELER